MVKVSKENIDYVYDAPQFLYHNDINFYDSFYLSLDNKAMFECFVLSKRLTDAKKEAILARCKEALFFTWCPEYAPEIKESAVAFPTKAFYKLPKEKRAKVGSNSFWIDMWFRQVRP